MVAASSGEIWDTAKTLLYGGERRGGYTAEVFVKKNTFISHDHLCFSRVSFRIWSRQVEVQ